jgi:hypothetical protein
MHFENTTLRKLSHTAFALFLFAPLIFVSAQRVEIAPVRVKPKIKQNVKQTDDHAMPAEKSIAVDAKVNVSLCVSEGNLKVTGWERNEIRAFVGQGSAVGFKILQKNRQNNAVWVMVTGSDSVKTGENESEECLSGEEIELDVPRGAVVNVKGRTTETKIEMVRKVTVKNIAGDIFLNNIEQGIYAGTYEGDVMVENSGGAITLESANGNIVALDVAPSEIGDIFKAKTNSGAIILQAIEHRQNEVSSISGSIKYVGAFQSGGQYNLRTTNGTISLAIPEKSSCRINASYGLGIFNTDIPLKDIVKSPSTKTQSLTGLMGGGDANVNLTTYSGAIRIKKQ